MAMAKKKLMNPSHVLKCAEQNHESSLDVLQRCLGSQNNKKPN